MEKMVRTALAVALAFAALGAAASAESDGSARATWKTNVIAQLTVTPNFAAG